MLGKTLFALVVLGLISNVSTLADQHLATCEAIDAAGDLAERLDHLVEEIEDFSETHPSAVQLARNAAGMTGLLESQLRAVVGDRDTFLAAWTVYYDTTQSEELARDIALNATVPKYRETVRQVEATLGCDAPESAGLSVACPTIPQVHGLAVMGGQLYEYASYRFGSVLPDFAASTLELAQSAARLHHLLHDIEVSVPGTRASVEGLMASLSGNDLLEKEDGQPTAVGSSIKEVQELYERLQASVGSCESGAAVDFEGEHAH